MIVNKTISSLDIKINILLNYLYDEHGIKFLKKFIENLGIEFQNLKTTIDLFFIISVVISSNKILFLDKVFIHYRENLTTSLENLREYSWDNFYYALKELKIFIKTKNLYKRFKQDWQLETNEWKIFLLFI